jgi:hypothetical protein
MVRDRGGDLRMVCDRLRPERMTNRRLKAHNGKQC